MDILNNIIADKKKTIREVTRVINKNSLGLCIIVDKRKLFGIVSDGDLRRLLIRNIDFKNKIGDYCNKKVVSLSIDVDNYKIHKLLSEKIKLIPLLDNKGNVVDYATKYRYRKISISEPYIFGEEYKNIKECLDTNWISSQGKFVSKFEEDFSKYISRRSLTVSSGTTGIQLAISSLNIKKNSEIILPVVTFAACINSILNAGMKPVLVDINKKNFVIDENLIEEKITKKTKAILAVHLYGYPCNMEKLKKICKKHNLFLIEDCAEAIGSAYGKKKVGTFSDVSVFSFFGNKTITTGEGGMICFKSKKYYEHAKILRDHGMSKKKYWHNYVGFNFRLTNLQAAIGCVQLKKLNTIVSKKIAIANQYSKIFSKNKNIYIIKNQKNIKNSFWLYAIHIKSIKNERSRDNFIKKLINKGVECRPMFYPLNEMDVYSKYAKNEVFKNASDISKKSICLPTSYNLNSSDIDRIGKTILKLLEN